MKQLKMLHFTCFAALVFLLLALPASAGEKVELMAQVYDAAGEELGGLDAENILIITDIGSPAESYVYLDDFYAEFYGNGLLYTQNLLVVQNPRNSPLWFAFFNKSTGDCVFIEVSYGDLEEISYRVTENINFEELAADAGSRAAWNEKISEKVFKGREFAIVTIANAWATGELDYELMQCLELHNHFCPGVSSGYVLANWVEDNYPLEDGVSYTVFSCPVWCKEDVFIKRWDTTPGTRGLWVSDLTVEEKEALGGSPAGIFVVTDKNAGTIKAVVLGFDFTPVNEGCGAQDGDPAWVSKYLMDLWMMDKDNWAQEGLVYEIEVIDIDADTLNEMKQADANPYVVLGLLNPAGKANPSKNGISGIGQWMNEPKIKAKA